MTLIKYHFNVYFERLHRYCFDYIAQSKNEDWGKYTPYKQANRNNKLEPYNGIIWWFYNSISPLFKGWRKQLKQFDGYKYERYENI